MHSLDIAPDGWKLFHAASATSSSDLAIRYLEENPCSNKVAFCVDEQTKGRGRKGRIWTSQSGDGMYLSAVIAPGGELADWPSLSFMTALSLLQAVQITLPELVSRLRVKWPNDVLAGGGKLCGILLEARGEVVVIGTGVNIAPVGALPGAKLPATSLVQLGDNTTDPETLARCYADTLMSRVMAYETDGFDPVRREWLSHCAHIEGMMRIARPEQLAAKKADVEKGGTNNIVEGWFAGLGADGALHLMQDDGERPVITTGDVDLVG